MQDIRKRLEEPASPRVLQVKEGLDRGPEDAWPSAFHVLLGLQLNLADHNGKELRTLGCMLAVQNSLLDAMTIAEYN